MAKRLIRTECAGIIIDVQEFFLKELEASERRRIESTTQSFASLLTYLRMPVVATLERPLDVKGHMPASIHQALGDYGMTIEKNFFDLTLEPGIADKIRLLGKKQIVIAGCETDVCVLQSCLGLIGHGYEVFVVEDLLFSSSAHVSAAVERMRIAGASVMTFKTLFHELLRAVDGSAPRLRLIEEFGPMPPELRDFRFI